MNQDLLKIVQRKIKKGYPEGELRTELRQQGMSESEINELFNARAKTKPATTKASATGNSRRAWLLPAACLIITGLALLSVTYYSFLGWFLLLPGVALLLPVIVKNISKDFIRK